VRVATGQVQAPVEVELWHDVVLHHGMLAAAASALAQAAWFARTATVSS